MNLFGLLDLSGSAMTAERQRAEVVTSNLVQTENARQAALQAIGRTPPQSLFDFLQ